jgi:hypothetical protein
MNAVRCSKCVKPLPLEVLSAGGPVVCPTCRALLEVFVFPAIHRRIGPGLAAELSLVEGETTCFFHADKKAVVVCNGCGRFLCALCDVPIGGEHLCPKCVEAGRTKKTLTTFENYRTSYPSLALTFAFLPLLIWPITVITAPLAVFLVLFGWRKPPSVTGQRRRAVMIIALIFALMQCAGWAAAFVGIYKSMTSG